MLLGTTLVQTIGGHTLTTIFVAGVFESRRVIRRLNPLRGCHHVRINPLLTRTA